MVSETVLGAIIGVTGALIGSLLTGALNWLSTRQQIQAENTRRHADYFLQRKVESLTELHAQLEETHQNYKFNWEEVTWMDEDDYETDILEGFYDFNYELRRASIFLDDEEIETMNEVYEAFRWANGYFDYHVRYSDEEGPGEEIPDEYMSFNEQEMSEAVEDARDVLRDKISEPVGYLET